MGEARLSSEMGSRRMAKKSHREFKASTARPSTINSTYAAPVLRMRWCVLVVQYTCVLWNRGSDGGESGPPRQFNKQHQPVQLGPNCTERTTSRRGCRRWPSSRKALAPRRVQENQARRLFKAVPGRSTSNAPVFCIPSDPFPRGVKKSGGPDSGTWGWMHVSYPQSLSSPKCQHRYEKRRLGGKQETWCARRRSVRGDGDSVLSIIS